MQIKTKLYKGEVELIFESFGHTYHREDEKVTSVTTALSVINKPALVAWAANMAVDYCLSQIVPGTVYDELQLQTIWENGRKSHYQKKVDAGNIGTFLHQWIEKYIKGENPQTPVNQGLKESIEKFLKWVDEHNVKFVLSEQQIYSKKYNYTGTLDFICIIDGKMYIGDLKTSSGIYPEMWVQTAAYRAARVEEYPEEKYDGQLILRIGKDGSFEVAKCEDNKWFKKMFVAFIAALRLHKELDEMKQFKAEKLVRGSSIT